MKNKFNIIVSFFLLGVILFASIPKVYIHSLLGHNHGNHHYSKFIEVSQNNETQDCAFEKFDTTVVYTVNEFYANFYIKKDICGISVSDYETPYFNFLFNNSFLRGPPLS